MKGVLALKEPENEAQWPCHTSAALRGPRAVDSGAAFAVIGSNLWSGRGSAVGRVTRRDL